MAGAKGRSGGHNRRSVEHHLIAGTFRPDRHGPMPAINRGNLALATLQQQDEAIPAATRRRVLAGLGPGARRIASELLDEFAGWGAAELQALRAFAQSAERLDRLQAAGGDDTRALHRELRAFVSLLRALNVGGAR